MYNKDNEISSITFEEMNENVNGFQCAFRLTSDRPFTLVKHDDKYYFELNILSKSYNDKSVKNLNK